ncbi:hypothetical protein GGE07_005505 [Sinorhizobium terangae]|uniref:Uncharacterized protein n=1 Tax=Sinorhizobium terangae TaxID=110322 RepID=A0A6N7LSP8_SINTE|nr:hypothetical protein [Sinorhizobium terangae]MBB4188826.1 hypothetical protein [Sinorhizobium terangae]MQX19325.1 hypothetical protein [Sinorhizobium terangae]
MPLNTAVPMKVNAGSPGTFVPVLVAEISFRSPSASTKSEIESNDVSEDF